MKLVRLIFFVLSPLILVAQSPEKTDSINTNSSAKKFSISAYINTYYAYNFNDPKSKDQPYLVSLARHNEININLAFLRLGYESRRVRASLAPAFGTYMNSNYAAETGTLKNALEAYVGLKLSRSKELWLDAGVLPSPYTNEGPVSKDLLTYTRSLSAENVPYYLSGARLTIPMGSKWNAALYIINGWQQITDQNSNKSLGTSIQYNHDNTLVLTWNTYAGTESSAIDGIMGTRMFFDFYGTYTGNTLSATSCLYYGRQEAGSLWRDWWQFNLMGRFNISDQVSFTARTEYFSDPDGVIVVPVTDNTRFSTLGGSLGLNIRVDENVLIRSEARMFYSRDEVFMRGGVPVNTSHVFTTGITIAPVF